MAYIDKDYFKATYGFPLSTSGGFLESEFPYFSERASQEINRLTAGEIDRQKFENLIVGDQNYIKQATAILTDFYYKNGFLEAGTASLNAGGASASSSYSADELNAIYERVRGYLRLTTIYTDSGYDQYEFRRNSRFDFGRPDTDRPASLSELRTQIEGLQTQINELKALGTYGDNLVELTTQINAGTADLRVREKSVKVASLGGFRPEDNNVLVFSATQGKYTQKPYVAEITGGGPAPDLSGYLKLYQDINKVLYVDKVYFTYGDVNDLYSNSFQAPVLDTLYDGFANDLVHGAYIGFNADTGTFRPFAPPNTAPTIDAYTKAQSDAKYPQLSPSASAPTNNQVLQYNAAEGGFRAVNPSTFAISFASANNQFLKTQFPATLEYDIYGEGNLSFTQDRYESP